MAQLTPPRKPATLLYTPRRLAHSLMARSVVRNDSWSVPACEKTANYTSSKRPTTVSVR
jgi:hypothetical protein